MHPERLSGVNTSMAHTMNCPHLHVDAWPDGTLADARRVFQMHGADVVYDAGLAEFEAALITTGTTPEVEELMIVAKPLVAQVPP